MEVLKRVILLLIMIHLIGCSDDGTFTQTIMLRTDTFISSASDDNNSELDHLKVSKSDSLEQRIIVKLPTTEEDEDTLFEDCFDATNLCGVFFLPLTILGQLLTDCSDVSLNSSNLTSAVLIFNTNDSSSIPAGSLNIELLSKPWWNTVTWNEAHPFSSEGVWDSPGGDVEADSFESNCTNLSTGSCASDEIKFEMTDFFRGLISSPDQSHYGFVISASSDLAESSIYSVQADSTLSPRIEATYTGSCSSGLSSRSSVTKTYYLGSPIVRK